VPVFPQERNLWRGAFTGLEKREKAKARRNEQTGKRRTGTANGVLTHT